MSFTSIPFLLFLAVFLVIYGLCPARSRRYLLLLGSAAFLILSSVTMGSAWVALWALIFTGLNFLLGHCVQRTTRPGACMAMAVAINAIAMAAFKLLNVGMLGLSYYLFSFMAYLAEIYRGTLRAEPDPVRFASFSLFFPKFIQGPITRYGELAPQLDRPRISAAAVQKGLEDFTLGFVLKVLVSDKLGVLFGGGYYALTTLGYDAISTKLAWLGAVVTSLHIYIEWQAYMFMALGLATMLGYKLPPNFNFPYLARTVGDYYRRWHMSLTRWFTDYIYIPLGGSRKGLGRTIVNVLFVWLVTSLWHGNGLAPKYLLWGLAAGAAVALDPLCCRRMTERSGGHPGPAARILGHLPLLLLLPVSVLVLWKPVSGFNFLIWGLSIGCMIVLERLWRSFVSGRFRVGERLGTDSLPGKLWKGLVSLLAHIWVVIPMVLSWVVFTIRDLEDLGLYFSRLFPAAGASAGADPGDFARNWSLVGPWVIIGMIFCFPIVEKLIRLVKRSRIGAWILSALLAGLFWYAVYLVSQNGSDPMGYAAF